MITMFYLQIDGATTKRPLRKNHTRSPTSGLQLSLENSLKSSFAMWGRGEKVQKNRTC